MGMNNIRYKIIKIIIIISSMIIDNINYVVYVIKIYWKKIWLEYMGKNIRSVWNVWGSIWNKKY